MSVVLLEKVELNDRLFEKYKDLVYKRSGISLNDNKKILVQSRLAKRLKLLGLKDYKEYYDYLMGDESGDELSNFIDVISTNVTHFYREAEHLKLLGKVVSDWSKSGRTRFRFWSAACSSGEEPFSMAITIAEALKGRRADVKILATDISTRILAKARAACYPAKAVEKISPILREKYFDKKGFGEDAMFTANSKLKNLVSFARINLAEPPYPMQGPFDIIFCRNVMIYFDVRVKKMLFDEFGKLLSDASYLMVGMSESTTGLDVSYRSVAPSVYRKI
ncbi:MAG: protein-glutamate O-methyltransferase CheR [Bacteroidales bacterium]|nr:protein-glutamate O-methyltransferase CheR [Candidatus Latescibacterota bacterium]